MFSINKLAKRLPLCALIVALAIRCAAAADDDDEDEQNGFVNQQQLINQQLWVLTPEQFDQWVFNGVGNCDQAMKQVQSQANMRIEAINRVCKLSDSQKQKLRMAADSDIKRFHDKYDALKQKLQNKKYRQVEVNQVFQQVQPLQQEWKAGILNEASLYNKVLRRTLDPDQSTNNEKADGERDEYRYRAKVKLAVVMLENSVPLTSKQREAFTKLLLEQTRPPKSFGEYDFYVVMLQAANLEQKKLAAIFDAAQLRALKQAFDQAKSMEPQLKQQGVLPD